MDDIDLNSLKEIGNYKKPLHFNQGDRIIKENHISKRVFVLLRGNVKIFKLNKQNKEYFVSLAKPGDLLGLHSVILDSKYSVSGIALEPSTCFAIPKDVFLEHIKKRPALFIKFMQILCNDIDSIEKRIYEFRSKTSKERLAECILLLQETYGVNRERIVNFSLKNIGLHQFINESEQKAARLVAEFEKDNLIRVINGKIQILDSKGIREIIAGG